MIGEKILGYTVEEQIGTGRFGKVYKVTKTNPSGTYIRALKHITIPQPKEYANVLNAMGGDYLKADEYFAGVLREIVKEIQIISTLSETGMYNIVRYYENDIVESQTPKRYDIYILMEYLTPFTEYLYQNQLRVRDVIKLGKDILKALIFCHEQGVIHRDIKDDNIFISSDGTYKIGDFGVSKILKERSRAKSMKGTPNFIAPEIYLGKEQYDDTVDVYSLGIVMYRLLNKSRNPFLPQYPEPYNYADEDVAFEKRISGETPPFPVDAQNQLGEVILKAIGGKGERFVSAKEFLDKLEEAEEKLSGIEMEKVVHEALFSQEVIQDKDKTIDTSISLGAAKRNKNTYRDRTLFLTASDLELENTEADTEIQETESGKKENVTKGNLKKTMGIVIGTVLTLIIFLIGKINEYETTVKQTETNISSVSFGVTDKILNTPTHKPVITPTTFPSSTPTPEIITPTCIPTFSPVPTEESVENESQPQEEITDVLQNSQETLQSVDVFQNQNTYQPPNETQQQPPQEYQQEEMEDEEIEDDPYEGLDDFIIVQ